MSRRVDAEARAAAFARRGQVCQVMCPTCKAPSGMWCELPGSNGIPAWHKEREAAWNEANPVAPLPAEDPRAGPGWAGTQPDEPVEGRFTANQLDLISLAIESYITQNQATLTYAEEGVLRGAQTRARQFLKEWKAKDEKKKELEDRPHPRCTCRFPTPGGYGYCPKCGNCYPACPHNSDPRSSAYRVEAPEGWSKVSHLFFSYEGTEGGAAGIAQRMYHEFKRHEPVFDPKTNEMRGRIVRPKKLGGQFDTWDGKAEGPTNPVPAKKIGEAHAVHLTNGTTKQLPNLPLFVDESGTWLLMPPTEEQAPKSAAIKDAAEKAGVPAIDVPAPKSYSVNEFQQAMDRAHGAVEALKEQTPRNLWWAFPAIQDALRHLKREYNFIEEYEEPAEKPAPEGGA